MSAGRKQNAGNVCFCAESTTNSGENVQFTHKNTLKVLEKQEFVP